MSYILVQASLFLSFITGCLCLGHNAIQLKILLSSSLRYGKIVSTKAILDKTTNKCKGVYGFLCFYEDFQ